MEYIGSLLAGIGRACKRQRVWGCCKKPYAVYLGGMFLILLMYRCVIAPYRLFRILQDIRHLLG